MTMLTRETFFSALRKAVPGIWNRPVTIKEGNELFDAFAAGANTTPDAPSEAERDFAPHRLGPKGRAIIKRFEGCARVRSDGRIESYPDPGTGGAPWTIGWGATGPGIARGTVWTRDQVEARFDADAERYAEEVIRALGSSITNTSQEQFDALVSFHYNTGAIGRATLTRRHKAGDFAGAAAEFAKWKFAGGRVLDGLVRRRDAEADLYLSGS